MELKVCTKCHKGKPISEFYHTFKRGKPYVRASCKECERKEAIIRGEKYRKTETYNSEESRLKRNDSDKKYRMNNKEIVNKKAREKNKAKYTDIRYRLMKLRQAMKRRCYNPNCDKYCYYGGKGIKIERETFEEFYSDMAPSYEEHVKEFGYGRKNTQIDRINPNGNYSKSNCRWVTAKENNAHNHAKEFNS